MFSRKVMIGICAYNEENNIARLLRNLMSEQRIPRESKILVMCSGCTDRTPQIVTSFQKKDPRIELSIESVRKGKANALNKIFQRARTEADILVLVNADAVPKKDTISKLVSTFVSADLGAAYAQPVPLESPSNSCSGITRLIWHLHHIISTIDRPKFSGELCALRSEYLRAIPENAATDEPYIESLIRERHKNVLYVPEAVVSIRCPTSFADIIRQRKRIWIGHMQLKQATGYRVSTSSLRNMLRALSALRRKETLYLLPGALLETVAYLEASIIFSKGTVPFVWEPIKSTKTSL